KACRRLGLPPSCRTRNGSEREGGSASMSATAQQNWKKDFGLEDRKPPHFFSSVDQLDDATGKVPQAHALRRAFEQLGIDGVFCQERSPAVYFRQVTKVHPAPIPNLHPPF